MKRGAGEALDAGNLGIMRHMQRAHAGDKDPRADAKAFPLMAIAGRDVAHGDAPLRGSFVPSGFTKARVEPNVRRQAVALDAGLQVLPDFLLAREHAGPIGVAFKGKRIKMSGYVTGAAGITVFVPGAAEVVTLLNDEKILHTGFEQLDAHANAGEARANNEHVYRDIR